jgi:6-phosphogluconolactonase
LLLGFVGPACADTFVYVSVAGAKKVAVFRMNPKDGTLTHQSDTTTEGEPGALTTDPQRRFLFAAMRSSGQLSAFRIDPKTGGLTHVNTVPAGADPAHISTDRSGRYLFTAYYVAGKVTVHAVGKDGTLGAQPVQSLATTERAHAILLDPSGRFAFAPHTTPDLIFQFTWDAGAGKLAANATPRLGTPGGSGPRHIVFHPMKDVAYVDNEQGGSVTAYALDTKAGTLKALQTVSTLPQGFTKTNACAEVRIHPGGKFLYVSNRGHDSIARFTLDTDGRLTVAGQEPTEQTPRSFDLDPSGRFLFAAGEGSGKLASYRVDPQTGALTRFATQDVGPRLWWVLAVEVPGK